MPKLASKVRKSGVAVCIKKGSRPSSSSGLLGPEHMGTFTPRGGGATEAMALGIRRSGSEPLPVELPAKQKRRRADSHASVGDGPGSVAGREGAAGNAGAAAVAVVLSDEGSDAEAAPKKAKVWEDSHGNKHELHFLNPLVPSAADLSDAEEAVRPSSNVKHSDTLSWPGEGEDVDDVSWRRGLEELRRTEKLFTPIEVKPEDRPRAGQLIQWVRTAVQHGDWTPVVNPVVSSHHAELTSAVEQLPDEALFRLLNVCSEHYVQQPRERYVCQLWIRAVLERATCRLAGRREFRRALRPLLQELPRRMCPQQPGRGLPACVGRWRLVYELARVRRSTAVVGECSEKEEDDAEVDNANLEPDEEDDEDAGEDGEDGEVGETGEAGEEAPGSDLSAA